MTAALTTESAPRIRFGFVLGLTLPGLLEMHTEWAEEAERVGAELLSAGEVPVLTPDPYLLVQSMAAHTSRAMVGPVVSMPGLRHPAVHARTMVTLNQLTGGRAFLGIGRGQGGLKLLGEPSAKMEPFIEYTRAVRALCAGEKIVYDGKELQLTYEPEAVPVLVSAFGPKAYEAAGRYADGMIAGNGATPSQIEVAREFAGAGAAKEGRSLDDLENWYTIRIHVAESWEQGVHDLGFYLSRFMFSDSSRLGVGKELTEDIAAKLNFYRDKASRENFYSFESENLELLKEFGLVEWGARQFFITGTIDEILPRLHELVQAGVRNFIVPQMLPDIMKSTRDTGDVFARLRAELAAGVTSNDNVSSG